MYKIKLIDEARKHIVQRVEVLHTHLYVKECHDIDTVFGDVYAES